MQWYCSRFCVTDYFVTSDVKMNQHDGIKNSDKFRDSSRQSLHSDVKCFHTPHWSWSPLCSSWGLGSGSQWQCPCQFSKVLCARSQTGRKKHTLPGHGGHSASRCWKSCPDWNDMQTEEMSFRRRKKTQSVRFKNKCYENAMILFKILRDWLFCHFRRENEPTWWD